MASSKSPLAVSLSPTANDNLWEIWGDNLERYKDVEMAKNRVKGKKRHKEALST